MSSSDFLEFALPTHATNWDSIQGFTWDESGCRTDCSWFGFKIAVKSNAPFSRTDLVKVLDSNLIGNRMLFGGNLIRQPAFVELKKHRTNSIREIGNLSSSDEIMMNTLFLGTYPGLTIPMLDKMIQVINDYVDSCR